VHSIPNFGKDALPIALEHIKVGSRIFVECATRISTPPFAVAGDTVVSTSFRRLNCHLLPFLAKQIRRFRRGKNNSTSQTEKRRNGTACASKMRGSGAAPPAVHEDDCRLRFS
jgi:hypothetical protein